MVRGMLETGYYHVLFELISQTKWSRWKRRHSLGGGGLYRDTLLLRTLPFALAHVSPAPAPHTAVLSSASGSGSVVLTALLSVFPQSHSTAGRT